MKIGCGVTGYLALISFGCLMAPAAFAANLAAVEPCPRPAAGSLVAPPPDLWSHNGKLDVTLNYVTRTDSDQRPLYCFMTSDGLESPTLHLKPGDRLRITLHNTLPVLSAAKMPMIMGMASDICGSPTMDKNTVNMHFHGSNTQPICHADNVTRTLVDSGTSFSYSVKFPSDEPPGLYWYHPHVHGNAETAVQGGESGAIIVDGLDKIQPAVAGLPERLLVLRDQTVAPGTPAPGGAIPSWDVSVNYVPIAYPAETPAVIQVAPGTKELWRVVNASADTIADLRLMYDGVAQKLQVVALDGVPVGSQDGSRRGKTFDTTDILLPTANRAEFIVTTPAAGVIASFVTTAINTGPAGDNDPARTLAVLKTGGRVQAAAPHAAVSMAAPWTQRFEGLEGAKVTAQRKLYFSEDPNTANPQNFYVTVDGQTPKVFNPANPPAITTQVGAVEEWTIENRTQELHEFHIHQIHFLVQEINGKPVPPELRQYLDTVQVPFWTGSGPYPSVKVRLDFRGNIAGDFVYHCHILGHEDAGMMAVIRVNPAPGAAGKVVHEAGMHHPG